jgi:cytochrome d ubiquinol oxidase subunit I
MTDFVAVLTNPYGLLKFGHQITAAYVVGAFFVMGVSAWHLLRKNETAFFKASFRMASAFGLAAAILTAAVGDRHTLEVVRTQPAKFAAMESVWETRQGAPMHLFLLPDPPRECNAVEGGSIPKLLCLLATHDPNGTVVGLKDFPPSERPPVLPVFLSFRLMVAFGAFFLAAALAGFVLSRKDLLERYPLYLRLMVLAIPLPYLANQLGWVVAEVGRQPWIVYGMLKTADAVSKAITTPQVLFSLAGFTLLYGFLGAVDIYLLARYARLGPADGRGAR